MDAPVAGLSPMSPLMMPPAVGWVMAAPARIVKWAHDPRSIGAGPAARAEGAHVAPVDKARIQSVCMNVFVFMLLP
jgi:hypothetical protein